MDPRNRKLALLVLTALLLLGAGCAYIGFKAYKLVFDVGSREEKPQLYAVPQPLTLTACRPPPSTKISYSGFIADFPWAGIESQTQYENRLRLGFDSGVVALLGRISEADEPLATFRKQDEETRRGLEAMWGSEATRSQYGFYTAVLNATPERLSLLGGLQALMGQKLLLMMKEVMLPTGVIELYSFQTESIKGFQISRSSGGHVELLAFDSPNSGLAVTIVPPRDSNAHLSQEEINCIIQSIRHTDEPSHPN